LVKGNGEPIKSLKCVAEKLNTFFSSGNQNDKSGFQTSHRGVSRRVAARRGK